MMEKRDTESLALALELLLTETARGYRRCQIAEDVYDARTGLANEAKAELAALREQAEWWRLVAWAMQNAYVHQNNHEIPKIVRSMVFGSPGGGRERFTFYNGTFGHEGEEMAVDSNGYIAFDPVALAVLKEAGR